ncbi:hypothetical protein [Halobacterium zhouii]|uniref:hypothetical protein n=1 Tax=Halobacterium zhouii TaxID=2902624 RepID=UPI001E3C954D|nr:hypothetical protein [Halobacterium zhouii]
MNERRDDEHERVDGNEAENERDADHLTDVEPGAGCVEIWEHLTEYRNQSEE